MEPLLKLIEELIKGYTGLVDQIESMKAFHWYWKEVKNSMITAVIRCKDKYTSALKEKHGDEGYDKVDLDPKAWTDSIEAVGKRNRSHLYGFSSLEGQRVLLKGSSSQKPTTPSTPNHQNEGLAQMITQALTEILPRILPQIIPGMLTLGFSPSANRSGDNVVSPSSQHDNEAIESEDGNDGENGDRMNLG